MNEPQNAFKRPVHNLLNCPLFRKRWPQPVSKLKFLKINKSRKGPSLSGIWPYVFFFFLGEDVTTLNFCMEQPLYSIFKYYRATQSLNLKD